LDEQTQKPELSKEHLNLGTLSFRVPPHSDTTGDEPITVIVSGVGRSGTSMVAKVLATFGIPMGKTNDLAVFEDQEFLQALLFFDFEYMAKLISARNAAHRRWGFKFASIQNHLFAPQLMKFRNPRLIVVMRDPVAIASRSYYSDSDRKSAAEALANVTKQISDMMNFVQVAACPTLLLSYEKCIAFPEHTIDALVNFCGLKMTDEQRQKARFAVEPNNPNYIELFHHSFRGHFDAVDKGVAVGWCMADGSEDAVDVELLADGVVVASTTANLFRKDLQAAGIGTGCHAFRIDLAPLGLPADADLQIRPVGSEFPIKRSPKNFRNPVAA
jgi:hypothetical protein